MTAMSRSIVFLLILILIVAAMARKSDKGSNIIIISPPNPDPPQQQQQQQPPPLPLPSHYMMHQFHLPPPPPTFSPPPPPPTMSIPYPLPMPSMSNFMHRSGLLSPPSLPPMPSGMNRELLRSLLASSTMNMQPEYPISDMNMESSINSDNYMSFMDPHQKMLQALLPNFLVLPIKVPQGSYSGGGRGSRPNKIPKSIADLMANHMSMEESSKKESIFNDSYPQTEQLRRSGHDTSLLDPPPTWEPSLEVNESLW